MAPENEETKQPSTPSDVDLLGFDPESSGTALGVEMKRVEALEMEKASESESQAQEREDKAKPVDDPASQAEGGEKKEAAPASKAETKSEETPKVEEVKEAEKGGFTFNGKTYKTEGEAEHAQSSYRGQLKSRDDRERAMEAENSELKAKLAEAERLSQTPATPKQEEKPKPASEDAKTGLDAFVDWKTYQGLYDHPDYGPIDAQRYLAMKNQEYLASETKKLETKFDETLQKRFEPIEMTEAVRAEFEETVGYFTELSQRVDEKGAKLFPEIQADDGDVEFITRVASRFSQDESLKEMGSYGVYLAVLAEKDWEKSHVPAVEGAEVKTPDTEEKPRDPKTGKFTKASEALAQFNKEREAAKADSVVSDGDGTPKPEGKGRGYEAGSWKAEVLGGLEKAAGQQEDKMVLGF